MSFTTVAKFTQLIDGNEKFSITSFVVYAVLVKVCSTSTITVADSLLLAIALLNYSGKKILAHFKKVEVTPANLSQIELDETKDKIKELNDKVSGLSLAMGFRKKL